METQYLPMILFWVVIMVAGIVYYFVKTNNNRKNAQTGADKSRVHMAAQALFGESAARQTLYAHWEEREHYGRTVKTTFYRYLVTYTDRTICVAPLYIDKNTHEIQPGRPSVFSSENLGKIDVKTRRKNGEVKRLEIWLGNKKGQTLAQFYVNAENLRHNKYFPVNIEQQDELAAFEQFITAMAQRVNAENPGVDELIKAYNNESLGMIGVFVSIIGGVASIFAPPGGAFVALVGLILSVVSKMKGATSKKSTIILIISIACAVLSAVLVAVHYKNFV